MLVTGAVVSAIVTANEPVVSTPRESSASSGVTKNMK
jgi:hypothetical protein